MTVIIGLPMARFLLPDRPYSRGDDAVHNPVDVELLNWMDHKWQDRTQPAASFPGPIIPLIATDSSRSNGKESIIGPDNPREANFAFSQCILQDMHTM
jgi:hypothetical protein